MISDNNFRHDLSNDHSINNDNSYDIVDGDIDLIQKLRSKHHNSYTRELKIRPTYEDCLKDHEAEDEPIQIDAIMIQPFTTTERSSVEAIPIQPSPDRSRSLVTQVSRQIDHFLRKQGASFRFTDKCQYCARTSHQACGSRPLQRL